MQCMYVSNVYIYMYMDNYRLQLCKDWVTNKVAVTMDLMNKRMLQQSGGKRANMSCLLSWW